MAFALTWGNPAGFTSSINSSSGAEAMAEGESNLSKSALEAL